MRKAALTVTATLLLVFMTALSAGSALAGWAWEDCPPVSSQGQAHASDTAKVQWQHVNPVVNTSALQGKNPGNKYK